jgi:hypothetical protein
MYTSSSVPTTQDVANIKAIAQTAQPISGLDITATALAITTYKDSAGVTPLPVAWDDTYTPTGEALTPITIAGHASLPDITA